MYNGQDLEQGLWKSWFRIKVGRLGQWVWLDPGEGQRGREVGLAHQTGWLCTSECVWGAEVVQLSGQLKGTISLLRAFLGLRIPGLPHLWAAHTFSL